MDTIRMDTNPLSAGGTDAAADTVDEQDRMLPMGRRKGNPFPERVFRPAGGREMGLKCLLTHRCLLLDKRIYRAAIVERFRAFPGTAVRMNGLRPWPIRPGQTGVSSWST